jgi:hypothetical protein
MHLISIHASPKQASKLRNGHGVRIKRGKGFNLIVHPMTYGLVSRAFAKDKGIQVQLSPEEIQMNKDFATHSPQEFEATHGTLHKQEQPMTSEEHEEMKGSGIFDRLKKAYHKITGSETFKKTHEALKPTLRHLTHLGKEYLKEKMHEQIAHQHQRGADYLTERHPENKYLHEALRHTANQAHHHTQGLGISHKVGHHIHHTTKDFLKGLAGYGLTAGGGGLYAGGGISGYDALRMQNMGTAQAHHHLAHLNNQVVHGQITQPPIKSYWDEPLEPRSRGTGFRRHKMHDANLIRGRGSMIAQDHIGLPPALQSQPFGENFHMQFFLPPEYRRYNDGGTSHGRGLYI